MKIAITGHQFFLKRYSGLLLALANCGISVIQVPSGNLCELASVRLALRLLRGTPLNDLYLQRLKSLEQSARGFELASRQTQRKIERLECNVDFVLQIFGRFAPFWTTKTVPYAMYLDFTMAQAIREWQKWAEFPNQKSRDAWLAVERQAYLGSEFLFTMGERVRDSLFADYGIPQSRVVSVGSGANIEPPGGRIKQFGSKQILFNGSDFARKGGDIVLSAFRIVRGVHPDARLLIVGNEAPVSGPGIQALGSVPPEQISRLLLSADLVVAPARCDPYPGFLIEAMAHGTPLVMSERNGIAERIANGVHGIVLGDYSDNELANCISRLLSDKPQLEEFSTRSRTLVDEWFNWNAVAKRMLEMIEGQIFLNKNSTRATRLRWA
jgi:glycosyltransferase involved in cell wall biosynthesis